jgi:hypothetical protein
MEAEVYAIDGFLYGGCNHALSAHAASPVSVPLRCH